MGKKKKQGSQKYNGGSSGRSGGGQSGRNSGQSYGGNQEYSAPYVGAPYNFVPIGKQTMKYPEEIPAHNSVEQELVSGEIEIRIEAIMPICVGGLEDKNGITDFYRNAEGNYALPGSTLRGLVRSNAQVLSHSEFGDDIEDYRLMFRDVAGSKGSMKDEYNRILGAGTFNVNGNQVSILRNVRCGYIENVGGKYVVYGTEKDDVLEQKDGVNYYIVSERYINEHLSSFSYLYSPGFPALQYQRGAQFEEYLDKWGNTHYKAPGYVNKNYRPFHAPVSYAVNGGGRISAIDKPGSYGMKQGVLVGTGFMQEKKALYVIPGIDRNRVVNTSISDRDIEAYNIDLNKKETILKSKKNGEVYKFYSLPKKGEGARPVFYIQLDSRFYFGYTPHLRLFYNHTIKEGLHQDKTGMDYAKALFGYAGERGSRKTRVSFSDAVINGAVINEAVIDGDQVESEERAYLLGEPKPTSYLDYIVQTKGNRVSSYQDDRFSIRGMKQYWNKTALAGPSAFTASTVTKFRTLPENSFFKGYVRFHNLRREELGLLLWSIELEEGSLQNIGRGKPYGFGTVRVTVQQIRQFDAAGAYDGNKESFFDPMVDITDKKESLVSAFKEMEQSSVKRDDFRKQADTFRKMKDKDSRLSPENTRYMRIGDRNTPKEYQDRKRTCTPLPTVDEVLKKCGK